MVGIVGVIPETEREARRAQDIADDVVLPGEPVQDDRTPGASAVREQGIRGVEPVAEEHAMGIAPMVPIALDIRAPISSSPGR